MRRVRAELDELMRNAVDPELAAHAYLGLLVNKGWIAQRPQIAVRQINEKLREIKFLGDIVMTNIPEIKISAGFDWTAYVNRLGLSGWLQFKSSDQFIFWYREGNITTYVSPDKVPRQVKAKLTRELNKLV